MLIYLVTVIILCSTASTSFRDKRDDSLVLVHVLFRHGDRTPDDGESLYRTDPYKDYEYYPYGKGQLTIKGKQTEYRIGAELRSRYGHFLGERFTPHIIDARSTDYNRTKMSLQLVLASLFPPAEKERWEPSLRWQPIPYNYAPLDKDPLLFPYNCPNFPLYRSEYEQTADYRAAEEKYTDLLAHLTAHTGVKYFSFLQLYYLAGVLQIQKEWGFQLPNWAEKFFPHPILDAAMDFYRQNAASVKLRKLMSGSLLEKIVMDTTAKLHNEKAMVKKKLFLYSAHEYSIASLLSTLDVFTPHIPPYGSYVALEIHNISNVHGLKVFYQNYSEMEPLQLKLPTCETFCPFENFVEIAEKYFPAPNTCGCKGC